MIQNQNRSGYFGASDTSYVVGNWNTRSFEKWWLEKLGFIGNDFINESMKTGNAFEHKIVDSLGLELEKDKQIIKDKLRVNLDANNIDTIYEIKTYRYEKGFKVSKSYWRQVQVQMYAFNIRNAYIVAYGLIDKDYNNFFNVIDIKRISFEKIDYDEKFINEEYLPKLIYLTKCLKSGKFPKINMEGN